MKDFLANNAKHVIDYGQFILILIIALCLFSIFKIGKGHKFYLPKTIFGWLGTLLSLLIIFISSLAMYGLQFEKNTTREVLNQFDALLLKKAPELTFNRVSNDIQYKLEDYKGQVVILNLWATWCAPCIREMPDLNKLHNQYKNDGLMVITLSDQERIKILDFQKSNTYDFEYVYNQQIEWLNMDIGNARPLTFIINREGIITDYHTGVRTFDFYVSKIEKLL